MDNMNTSCFPIALAALKSAKSANERIDTLPLPMVFKGTLGNGGTIETLPAASSDNVGFVYIVITNGTYSGQTAKAGDLFVSDGISWVLVPSADEPYLNVKSFTYTGGGQATHDIVFPEIPVYVFDIYGSGSGDDAIEINMKPFVWGEPNTICLTSYISLNSNGVTRRCNCSYNDKTLTLSASSSGYSANVLGKTYTVYYI